MSILDEIEPFIQWVIATIHYLFETMIFELPGEFDVHVFLRVHQPGMVEITMVLKIQPCLLDPETHNQDISKLLMFRKFENNILSIKR